MIATKYTLSTRPGDPNSGGNHRKNMVQSVEASLRRLDTDYIDLYYLHAWDGTTPVDEVMRAFDDLVRAGKVLYVGISDVAGVAGRPDADDRRAAGLVAARGAADRVQPDRAHRRARSHPDGPSWGWASSRGRRWPAGC